MGDLPEDVVAAVRRLTCLVRDAVDESEAAAYRRERDELLAGHGFVARVREEESGDVLVCYPAEWVDDGTVRVDRIDDTDRAVEESIDGAGAEGNFDEVAAANREVVRAVEDRAGPVHAANASAFADFMANHYVRRVETATPIEVREFLDEYYPRNVWPTDEQREVLEASIRLVFDVRGVEPPPPLRE